MEPQDLAGRELQAIKKRLCYISSTVCALCLVCLATTLALFLSQRTTQGTCVQYPCNSTASPQLKCNCVQYPCNSIAYAQLKWSAKKNSKLVLWKEGNLTNGMKYQDGNLTILSKGLYFINCRLHFVINKCLQEDKDLYTKLLVNGRTVYEVLNTVLSIKRSSCKIYTDQHLSLHIELNAADNLSVNTNVPEWLNDELLTDRILFEAFKLQYQ